MTEKPDTTPPSAPLSESAEKSRPFAKWASILKYDPDEGCRSEDFQTKSDEYETRFHLRESITPEKGDTVYPELEGVLLVPEKDSRRWVPQRFTSVREVKDFFYNDERGKHKRYLEQFGSEFGDFDPTQFPAPSHLFDREFVPLMWGPFYKQLYVYDYLNMHARAFELTNHNALAAAAVKIMTRFTLGRGVSFLIKDPRAQAIWDEFWDRNNMRKKLRQMARDLTWQGELMLRYYEGEDGRLTMKVVDPSSCWEVVTDPEDLEKTYYFHFQWPCVEAKTRIACLDGTNPTIEELSQRKISKEDPLWVYSYDHEAQRIVPGKAIKCWKAGKKRCVEACVDSGEKIVASFDHPFLLRSGEYRWAEQLQPGDSLMPLYRRTGYEEVWQPDGTWESTHRMIASEHLGQRPVGFVTHHLNHDRRDNRPDNLAYLSKIEHDAETQKVRWEDPTLAIQRERWVAKMQASVKRAWKKGTYDFLRGKRPAKRVKKQSEALKARWRDPEFKARRVKELQEGRRKSPRKQGRYHNHKVVSVRPAGMHVVYDLQVEKHHNFALSSGVFTHNSPWQIWTSGKIPVTKYIIQQIPPTNLQHIKINVSAQEKRGRSDFMPAMPWLKRFNDYYNGATLEQVLKANLVWKVKVLGDQADVDAIMNDPKLTEMPPPGGVWVENPAVELTPMTAQIGTAGRGQGIGGQIAAIVATSLNLPNEYFNIESGAGGARATALVRTDPAVKAIEDRQQILREAVEEIYQRVMQAALSKGLLSGVSAREEPEAISDDSDDETTVRVSD